LPLAAAIAGGADIVLIPRFRIVSRV
jgi:hypothetical protein